MKCVRVLPATVLISLLSINLGVATSEGIEQVSNRTSFDQTKPVVMANIFSDIQKGIETVEKVNQTRLREQRRQEAQRKQQEYRQAAERRMQERKQAFEKRRQELEVARREATERQRLEAARRQQYFESLSPEEKKAYLADQTARREKADKAAGLFLLSVLAASLGTDTQNVSGEDSPKPNVVVNKNSEPQIIYSNDKPGLCKLEKEKKNVGTCDSFKIVKQAEAYYLTYYFDGKPISFVSVLFESKGEIETFMVGEIYSGGNTIALKKPGYCVRSKKLARQVTCSANNVTASYAPN